MRILVTGASGFIGANIITYLNELKGVDVLKFTRENDEQDLLQMASVSDAVIHLAGVNRPLVDAEFEEGNTGLTKILCDALSDTGRVIPVVFSSSIQADLDNPYGKSKHAAEEILDCYSKTTGSDVFIYRLSNVFGKWCRPNYNSVVATFCHNIANNLPIQINDPKINLALVYIDDVVKEFVSVLLEKEQAAAPDVFPVYNITLGELAEKIRVFHDSRKSLVTEEVGSGLIRALYATYISYFKPEMFSYPLVKHKDERGIFAEFLKTKDSGQFSFFTANPGVTRGGHYHHTKNEKFLVVSGMARFKFKNVVTGEKSILDVSDAETMVVETVPGWIHDITNIGDTQMVVMLWANEIFDEENPDTFAATV